MNGIFALLQGHPCLETHCCSPSSYLLGNPAVFYLPKTIRDREAFLEARLGGRVVLLHREKVSCWKCTIRHFPVWNQRPSSLEISASHAIEITNRPYTHLYYAKKIKRVQKLLADKSIQMRRLQRKLDDTIDKWREAMERQATQGEEDAVHNSLLETLIDLYQVPPKLRRYEQKLLELCEIFYTSSPKCYALLRQTFPFPSPSTLFRHFGGELNEIKLMISDPKQLELSVSQVCSAYVSSLSSDTCMFTLAIDAFACRSFSSNALQTPSKETDSSKASAVAQKPKVFSHGFIFLLVPLDSDQEPRILHIHAKSDGCYTSEVHDVYKSIRAIVQDQKLCLAFKATDGDPGVTKEHKRFFARYWEGVRHDFTLATDTVYEHITQHHKTLPIADPLHFAKNARARLIRSNIVLQTNGGAWGPSEAKVVTAIDIDKVLDLGDALQDASVIGKMRDIYVVKLFTLGNVAKLISQRCVAGAFFLLPYACVFAAIFQVELSNEARLFFIRLAYQCFLHFLDEIPRIIQTYPSVKTKGGDGVSAVTITERSYVIRMLHTCIGLAIAVRHGPKRVRMDAIGTHLVENCIGNARAAMNDPRWERIISKCAGSELRKRLAKRHGLILRIRHRVNDGGAKVSTCCNDGIKIPPSWDAYDIVQTLACSLVDETSEAFKDDLNSFAVDLCEIGKLLTDPFHASPSRVANCGIMARNISFASHKTEEPGGSVEVSSLGYDYSDSASDNDDE